MKRCRTGRQHAAFDLPSKHVLVSLQIKLLEREMDGSKLLVFCETKRGCDTVTRQLRQDGWPALAIHGDKSQQERDWVLAVSLLALSLRAQRCAQCQ